MATIIEQGTQQQWVEDHSEKQAEQIDIPQIAGIVFAGWYKILICVMIGWVLAGAYYVTVPSTFQSSAGLYVMYNDPSLAASGVGSGADSDSVSEDLLATQMQIIQSRMILKKMLDRELSVDVFMPQVNEAGGTILSWVKSEGDHVSRGDVLAVLDTEQGEVEVVCAYEGKLQEIHFTEGATLQSGEKIASVEGFKIANLPSLQAALDGGQSPVDYLMENLRVSRGGSGQARDAHSLSVSITHSSPEDSRIIVEVLLAEYHDYVKHKFQDVNADAAVLINQARTDLEIEMEKAREEFAEFRINADPLWSGENSTNIHRMRYEQIQNELSLMGTLLGDAQTRLRVVKEALIKMDEENAPETHKLALIDEKNAARMTVMLSVQQGNPESGVFAAKQPERMEHARSEYTGVLTLKAKKDTYIKMYGWGPSHPQIVSLNEQIKTMEDFLFERGAELDGSIVDSEFGPTEVIDAYVKLLENDVVALQARKADLEKESLKEEAAAKELISEELRGIALQDKIAHQQDLQEAVVERLKGINIAKEFGGIKTDVIEHPEVGKSVWPKLPICLALGTVLGLVVGGSWTALSEFANRSFRSSDEVKSALETQVLSHVPNLRFERDFKLLSELKKKKSVVSPSIYAHHLPKSVNAEVFRGLRTSVLFKCQNGEKVFCVTSPNQGDGKSTLLTNLAASIAQTDRKTLIVDCDMRRPSIHALLGLHNDEGLANVIENDLEPWDLIQETEIPNLAVLPTGGLPHNPAELLETRRFRNLLEVLRERFDFVLLDCPPVLAVADPSIVAPLTDGCLLLVNVSRDTRADATHSKDILDSVRTSIMGVVVAGGESKKARGYTGTYGQYGGYGGGNRAYYAENS